LWGKRDDGSWGIKDRNAASDADLWFAYTLLEAGRLWRQPQYDALGRKLLTLIKQQEIVAAGRVGTLLLPAPIGFALANDRYRINPSYLPGFMFTYLSDVDGPHPWRDVWQTYERLAPSMYATGVAPDNVIVDTKGKVYHDTERTPYGSYDAIRVYLWAGMSPNTSADILKRLTHYATLVRSRGEAPEKVDPMKGVALRGDYSPIGYAGALLPYLSALNDTESLSREHDRVRRDFAKAQRGSATNYYDQVLILFGAGWADRVYRFDERGRLVTSWSANVAPALANQLGSR
jgi:endoglucanase